MYAKVIKSLQGVKSMWFIFIIILAYHKFTDYAETYPYMLFHPVDSPDYKEYYGKRFGYSGNVYSRKYKNSASKLCEEAWQVFYGSLVADKFDTVNIRSFKTVWPEK